MVSQSMTRERIASSLARPPALRMTWASPSARPAYFAGSSLASMQVKHPSRHQDRWPATPHGSDGPASLGPAKVWPRQRAQRLFRICGPRRDWTCTAVLGVLVTRAASIEVRCRWPIPHPVKAPTGAIIFSFHDPREGRLAGIPARQPSLADERKSSSSTTQPKSPPEPERMDGAAAEQPTPAKLNSTGSSARPALSTGPHRPQRQGQNGGRRAGRPRAPRLSGPDERAG